MSFIDYGVESSSDSVNDYTTQVFSSDTRVPDDKRFAAELYFVEMLGINNYVEELKKAGYLDQPAFINYLKYLRYWLEPPYCAYVKNPSVLLLLNGVHNPEFLKRLKINPNISSFLLTYASQIEKVEIDSMLGERADINAEIRDKSTFSHAEKEQVAVKVLQDIANDRIRLPEAI